MGDTATFYVYEDQPNIRKKYDYLVRLQESSDTSSYDLQFVGETREIVYSFTNLRQENWILKSSLKNLWKTHQYNQEYISYLLGTHSKEEFKEIAKRYAEPIEECADSTYLLIAAHVLPSILQEDLQSTDMSVLLNVTPSCIEEGIKQIEFKQEDS